jgi:ssDNA-binding replication factor A large subunit
MSTAVAVYTYAHSVTYVTDKLLNSVKKIVQMSGLDPDKLTEEWSVLERGISTWLGDQHLETLHLEVFHEVTGELVRRWDFDVAYDQVGDGSFWQDPDDIRYHIEKAGINPANCDYRIVTSTNETRRDVAGWSKTSLRSTEGFVRQGIGTTIGAGGLSTGTSYWRKK